MAYRFEIAGYEHHVNATGTDLVQHEEQVRHYSEIQQNDK